MGCFNEDKLIRYLSDGDSFGEQALYKDGRRSLTVKALEPTNCLAISRKTM